MEIVWFLVDTKKIRSLVVGKDTILVHLIGSFSTFNRNLTSLLNAL